MSDIEKTLPIAEIFSSVQGEGFWAGAAMCFIRLAGCNVGKPYTEADKKSDPALAVLSPYQERCADAFGNSFSCDTNFQVSKRMTIEEIFNTSEVNEALRVCITGGEPLIHDIWPLIDALGSAGKWVHLETSGTKSLANIIGGHSTGHSWMWITVCPKQGFLPSALKFANEIKILVDASTLDEQRFNDFLSYVDIEKVWLQPVNHEHSLNMENVKKCLEIQSRYKKLRLSIQLHKILQVR